MPMAFVADNYMAASGVSAGLGLGGVAGTYGATWLHDQRTSHQAVTLSPQTTGTFIGLDLGAAKTVGVIALIGHNLGSFYPDVVIIAADDSIFTVNVVTALASAQFQTERYAAGNTAFFFPAVYSRRYWRLALFFGGSQTFRVAELVVGQLTSLGRSNGLGGGEALSYSHQKVTTAQGEVRRRPLSGPFREVTLKLQDASEDVELTAWRAMFRAGMGGAKPVLWLPYGPELGLPDNGHVGIAQECVFGRLISSELERSESSPGIWQPGELVLREHGRELLP